MPGPEDPLRSELERLATPADPAGAYERIVEKKIRRQIYRKLQVGALAVIVVAGTVGGSFVLASAFRSGRERLPPVNALAANGMIAFVSDRDGNPDVFVMERDGTHVTNLTRSPANDHSPAFSPDGTKIAFVSDRAGGSDIFVMNADGSEVRRVTTLPGQDDSPSWSPEGTRIAFVSSANVVGDQMDYELYVMSADGEHVTRLTKDLALTHDARPAWSPDGSRLAFTAIQSVPDRTCPADASCAFVNRRGVIMIAEADGSGARELRSLSVDTSSPAWSPDGSQIAFEAQGDLYVMASDGKDVRRVTSGPAVDGAPTWSPSGDQLVFSSDLGGDRGIDVVDVNGSARKRLTSGVAKESAPSWQPLPNGRTPAQPAESPTETPSPSPEPSPSPSPWPKECDATVVTADFDGDGIADLATVARTTCLLPEGPGYPFDHPFALEVRWGGGSAGTVPLPDCQEVCQAFASADLNDDGSQEFVLLIGNGASTSFFEIYELPLSEAFGQHPASIAPPGAPGYDAGAAAVLAVGGSVPHLDFLACPPGDGSHEIHAISYVLNDAESEYVVHETVFTFDTENLDGEFVVVSTHDSTFAFDPTGQKVPGEGPPCWYPASLPPPPPSPSSGATSVP